MKSITFLTLLITTICHAQMTPEETAKRMAELNKKAAQRAPVVTKAPRATIDVPASQPSVHVDLPVGLSPAQWLLAKCIVGFETKSERELSEAKKILSMMQRGRVIDGWKGAYERDNNTGEYIFYSGAGQDGNRTKASLIAPQQRHIQAIQDRLSTLKSGGVVIPDLMVDKLDVDTIGRVKYPSNVVNIADPYQIKLEVVQVISDKEMLVKIFGQLMWMSGYSTATIVDGKKFNFSGVYYISGTKKYETLTGQRTVLVIQPVSLDNIEQAVKYLRQEMKL